MTSASPQAPRLRRVYWTDEEKHAIAREYFGLRKATGNSRLLVLEQAQERALPPARRRKIVALTSLPWLEPMVERLREAAPAQAQPPAPEPPDTATLLRERLVDELTLIGRAVLANLLRDPALRVALADLAAPAPPPAVAVADNVRALSRSPRLPRVLVAGLLPGQAADIERAFSHRFDLRFWDKEGARSELKAALPNAEFVVGMTSFLGHADDGLMAASAPGRYLRVEGGMTRLRDALRHIAEHRALPQESYRVSR